MSESVIDYWTLVLAGYRSVRELDHLADGTGYAEFTYLSFLMFANHVSDQLIRGQPNMPEEQVRDYVNSTASLRMCRDISNTTKHHTLIPTRRALPSVIGQHRPGVTDPAIHVVIGTDASPVSATVNYYFNLPDGPVNARELATGVLLAWRDFGLSINASWLADFDLA